jgi:hypothetical protein
MALFINDQILWFKISMYDLRIMKMLYCEDNLSDDSFSSFLLQINLFLQNLA